MTGQALELFAPLPDDFRQAMQQAELQPAAQGLEQSLLQVLGYN